MSDARIIGRYAVYGVIASGGMATVHYGRLLGQRGFSRTVAIKRLHPELASDPALVSMLVDEARLVARIRHPNVVPTLDVVASGTEVLVVMDYVAGESLARLHKMSEGGRPIPIPIVAAVMADVLRGLQAAHDARDARGEPLGIVHRDVSPQNILVGIDGQARILDFGVAKAEGRSQTTDNGVIKGKIGYMSPEQVQGEAVTLHTDLFAAAIVLWELLAGRRLFVGSNAAAVALQIISDPIELLAEVAPSRAAAIAPYDAVLARALERDPRDRFASARQMREALEACGPMAPPVVVADWVQNVAFDALAQRAQALAEIESRELSTLLPVEEHGPVSAGSSSVPPAIEHRPRPAKTRARLSVLWALVGLLAASLVVVLFLDHTASGPTSTASALSPGPPPLPLAPQTASIAPPALDTTDGGPPEGELRSKRTISVPPATD